VSLILGFDKIFIENNGIMNVENKTALKINEFIFYIPVTREIYN